MAELGAIVLAAGAGRRVGTPKARLLLGGASFLQRVVQTLLEAGVAEVVVVLGAEAATLRRELPLPLGVRVEVNPAWESGGMLSSLQLGLLALGPSPGALVWPVDHPAVRAKTVRQLVEAFGARGAPVVLPTYRGERGHPVIFGASTFGRLAQASPEEGARAVVKALGERVEELAVDDPFVVRGVNTQAELDALLERLGAPA